MTGQLIKTLVGQKQAAGYYSANWDGKNYRGQNLASGIYFYRLEATGVSLSHGQSFVQTRKMMLVR